MDDKIQELLDECIGDPESMRKLFIELIAHEENIHAELENLVGRFDRSLILLGQKGKITEKDKLFINGK